MSLEAWAFQERDDKAARLLDDQLQLVYGESFPKVVEYEFKGSLNLDLYDALRTDLAGARLILAKIFQGEDVVDLILAMLSEKLVSQRHVPEGQKLLALVDGLSSRIGV